MNVPSPNTKAILLLTAPLSSSPGKGSRDALTLTEYRKLAARLRKLRLTPADFLEASGSELVHECRDLVPQDRLQSLLDRGFQLSQALERWRARALWVVSRADPGYPQRLKDRLKDEAPPVLYGCGDEALLNRGGLAVVGSRNVSDVLLEYAATIGRHVAAVKRTLASGGARGIDLAAMHGALDAGGTALGVLADGLEKKAMSRENREHLRSGRLVLVSPYDPNAGFNVGHAMRRNGVVYALADAALVVNAEIGKGGTWAGATEQLERHSGVPIYVRTTGPVSEALKALQASGALPWPDDMDGTVAVEMALTSRRAPTRAAEKHAPMPTPDGPRTPKSDAAEELFRTALRLIRDVLSKPKKPAEVAEALQVTPQQADQWLRRLLADGIVVKTSRPVRYSLSPPSLFSMDGEGEESMSQPAKAARSS